jgi:TRAP-type C4-dicarboxylate transport system permease small subunit
MSFMKSLKIGWERFSERVNTATGWVCIVLILFMSVEVIVAVFFRYALDAPIKWGEELARLIMVWAGLLGVSIALKDGEHVGVEVLTGRLSGKCLAWCNLITHLLVGLFLVVLVVWGVQISKAAWGTFLPALQIKWTWSHAAVPVTAAIQLVHLIALVLDDICRLLQVEQATA